MSPRPDVTAVPGLAVAMKIGGSVYLLYLAWQIAGAEALARGSIARPLGLGQAAAFQVINPKAWIFALGAITTFRPESWPVVPASLAVAATMLIMIVPTASLWAVAGGIMGRLLAGGRWHRVTAVVLAAFLVATVAYVWI